MSTSLEQSPSTAQVCPVCSSTTIEFQFAKRGHPIVRCTDCDTAFHPARPSIEALRDLYSERYFTAGGFEGYPDYAGDEPAHPTQARYYLNHIPDLGIRPTISRGVPPWLRACSRAWPELSGAVTVTR